MSGYPTHGAESARGTPGAAVGSIACAARPEERCPLVVVDAMYGPTQTIKAGGDLAAYEPRGFGNMERLIRHESMSLKKV